ncbi:hypothetical protein FNV45_16480 [Pseudomonas aeruginosa]|nr:hypothetical protein [Pseudomonas aeruginosa]QFZ64103.1 hypothetical protein FVF66_28510 [Pseudomonas aeruginosa PA99]RPP76497.1 hypothetical protein IPC1152_18625 [Pseudomonas aeruginosa]RTA84179.1 hypothetical protein EJ607_25730 [Pseudomonas aeruginosa]RTU46843.1 hypothetical protein DY970_23625 [Pseudomonas aeruginosa]
MPVRPAPLTFSCSHCSWQRTTIPASDALEIGRDCFVRCPRCGHEPVGMRRASSLEVVGAKLERLLHLS